MRTLRHRRGFTMIELLTAIAIIAILAAIAIPRFVTARYRAYLSACSLNLRNVGTALESYRTDNRSYPPTTATLITANIITKLPTCPSAPGNPYPYVVAVDGESYTLNCPGYHHYQILGRAAGYPQYEAAGGFRDGP